MITVKRRRGSLVAAVCAALAMAVSAGLSPAQAAGDQAATTQPEITGRVVMEGTGLAVARAQVVLKNADASRDLRRTYTNDQGRYAFTDLSKRSYTVWVVPIGDPWKGDLGQNFLATYYGNTVHADRATKIKVARNATYRRNVQVKPGAALSIATVDGSGKPVRAWVSVTFEDRYGDVEFQTPSTGRVTVTGRPAGKAVVRILEDGDYQTIEIHDRAQVTLVPGRTTAVTLNPTPTEMGTLTGRVLSPRRYPKVLAYEVGGDQSFGVSRAADGMLSQQLNPGRYRVIVEGRNVRSSVVTVTAGGVTDVGTLTDPVQSTTVKGKITCAPGAGCGYLSVTLWDQNGTYLRSDRLAGAGRYSISGAAPGRYTLTVSGVSERGTGEMNMKRTVTVPAGVAAVTKDVAFRGYRVRGKVLMHGKPVRDVRVAILGTGRGKNSDLAGRFHFDPLPVGSSWLRLREQVVGGYRDRYVKVVIKDRARSLTLELSRLSTRAP